MVMINQKNGIVKPSLWASTFSTDAIQSMGAFVLSCLCIFAIANTFFII